MCRATLLRLAVMLALWLPALPVRADVLETRDGRVLEGTYLGGTRESLRFETGDAVEVFLTGEVRALRFAPPEARPTSARPSPPSDATRTSQPTPATAATPRPSPPGATATPNPSPPPATPNPPPATSAASPGPAPATPRVARVPAGTTLRVRMVDGIDSRTSAAGDRFGASLETGLGADGVAIVPAGTKLYGQIAELRATGPVASRIELELTQLMIQGELIDIVTGSQQVATAQEAAPASASTIPSRPGFAAGSVLEFRLLQPFEVRVAP